MTTYPKLAISIIIFTILAMALHNEPKANARFFCAYGKVFIEFEEDGKVWGTMWIDEDGRPLTCKGDSLIKTKEYKSVMDV